MKEKINYLLNNTSEVENFFTMQQNIFNNEDLNYQTIKKIENFIGI